MKDLVFMITELDSNYGFATGRRIFLLKNDDKFIKAFNKICSDKKVKGTYTTVKEVIYS